MCSANLQHFHFYFALDTAAVSCPHRAQGEDRSAFAPGTHTSNGGEESRTFLESFWRHDPN